MRTLANSEYPDEMQHNRISSVYTLFAKTNTIFRERDTIIFTNFLTCDPQYIQWTIPSLSYDTKRENMFGHIELKAIYPSQISIIVRYN